MRHAKFRSPVQVVHTGKEVEGQIYVPAVNWALCVLGLAALAGFRDSTAIGNAFSARPAARLFSSRFCFAVLRPLLKMCGFQQRGIKPTAVRCLARAV